jgi:hypothetical protein
MSNSSILGEEGDSQYTQSGETFNTYHQEVIINHLLDFSFTSLKKYTKEFSTIVNILPNAIENYCKLFESSDGSLKCKLKDALDTPKKLGLEVHALHREDERRLVFEAAFVMTLFMMPAGRIQIWSNVSTLIDKYPMFSRNDIDEKELNTLLHFRNMMAVAILVLPPKSKKAHLLDLVTRIVEGNDVRYITGSGETAATRRRVTIYELEGNITPLPRPPRRTLSGSLSLSSDNISYQSDTASHSPTSTTNNMSNRERENKFPSPQNEMDPIHFNKYKRPRTESEVNFSEAANVLLLLCSQQPINNITM